MAKRSNNSLGRRSYGGKPYDANNSFVKKMANKVTDLIPQRSWISKWFNASQDNGVLSNEDGISEDAEDEAQQPPAKRPRIRMDVTHPPGTFAIRARDKDSNNDTRKEHFARDEENDEYFLEPAVAGPSGACKFVSSTPAIRTEVRNSETLRARPVSLVPTNNNGASNGVDDNSESGESTSGCSSLIPQTNRQEGAGNSTYSSISMRKRFIDDKLSSANNSQSPRCLFLDNASRHEPNSNRRPSFNATMMNNNNNGNALERSSSLSSPFYSGDVTFGGANALGSFKRSRSLFNSNNDYQLKIPRRTNVLVKPSNAECIDPSAMSQTAKRILEAMEYFSSPITDAKKIPIKNSAEHAPSGKKRSRDERISSSPNLHPTTRVGLRHLTRELAVPTVPDMLKLRRRQKLQDTTVAARKIISAMSGPPPATSWSTTTSTTVTSTSVETPTNDYRLRTELNYNPEYHGKLRTKVLKSEEPRPPVNLPNITLPITSLPRFDPLPAYTIPTNVVTRKSLDNESTDEQSANYKFSSPIKITKSAWNLKSINNFSFSKPIIAQSNDSSDQHRNEGSSTKITNEGFNKSNNTCVDGVATNFIWSGSSTAPRLKAKRKQRESNDKNASPSIKGISKLNNDTTQIDKNLSSSGESDKKLTLKIWECAECYIKNDCNESSCVACKASKPRENDKVTSRSSPMTKNVKATTQSHTKILSDAGFGSQFKMNHANQWECDSCLVRNEQTSLKCVACSTPKSGSTRPTSESRKITSTKASMGNDLIDKFRPAEGSWECPGCMLRNPSSVITCPCCNAAKPSLLKTSPKKASLDDGTSKKSNESGDKSALVEKFKPAANTWECSSCMVRNNETADSCVCCSNPKPGKEAKIETATPSSEVSKVSFGWGDKFKKPLGSWSCESCMVQNKSEIDECAACGTLKSGATAKPQVTSSQFSFGVKPTNDQNFTFGIDKAGDKAKTDSLTSTNGFTFGGKPSETVASAGKFTFGVPKQSENIETIPKVSSDATGFTFAPPKTAKASATFADSNKINDSSRDATKSSTSEETTNPVTFSFGMPKTLNEKPLGDKATPCFGAPSSLSSDDTKKNSSAQFVFGIKKTEDKGENPSITTSNIGAATSEKPSIFGNPMSTTNNDSNIVQAVAVVKSISEEQNGKANASSSLIPSSNLQTTSPFTFSEPKSKQATSIAPNFGQNSTPISTPTQATFSITGSSSLTTNSTASDIKTSATPTFGIPAPASSATSSAFGIVASTTSSTIVNDGKTIDSCSTFPQPEKKAATFFGITGEKRQASSFGGPAEKKSQVFGTQDSNKLTFGTSEKSITSNTMFNSSGSSGTFGGSSIAPSQSVFGSSTTPVFGANTVTPTFGGDGNVGTSNIFAAGGKSNAPTAPSNQGLFTFGATSSQQQIAPQSTSGAFSFSTDNADPSSSIAKPMFAFGNATPAPQSNDCFGSAGVNAGGFGSTASTTVPTGNPPPYMFNAPSSKPEPPPAFGQTTAPIPNIFGTSAIGQPQNPPSFQPNATASSAAFTFGAAAPSTITGGFNFGAGMTQPANPAPASGFNFNAPAATPTITFDPNTRPSFNFTGGSAPTVFNAPPQQPVTNRKIKKAVRRMQQR